MTLCTYFEMRDISVKDAWRAALDAILDTHPDNPWYSKRDEVPTTDLTSQLGPFGSQLGIGLPAVVDAVPQEDGTVRLSYDTGYSASSQGMGCRGFHAAALKVLYTRFPDNMVRWNDEYQDEWYDNEEALKAFVGDPEWEAVKTVVDNALAN